MATIDTAKAAGFRGLAFATIADALREGERIAAAETAGGLARIGNWTPGQAFGHIAAWINFGFDGFPPEFRPPWAVRMLMKLMKSSFINKPMRRGVRIPGLAAGTLAMDPVPTERGLHLLRQALARLEAGSPGRPHPILGPLTHEEWKKLHLHHAALHMGYFVPAGG